jgi:hypothetical protein
VCSTSNPYSFLNERLARHWLNPNVWDRSSGIDLSGTPRGGILTQGVLAVSSYATRTSPVLRGKWVLENLLNAPPPEPPADVPNLDETKIGTAVSMREQLEEHRKNAICASCHRRMDPLDRPRKLRCRRRMDDGRCSRSMPRASCRRAQVHGAHGEPATSSRHREAFGRAITSKLRPTGWTRSRALRQPVGEAYREPAAELTTTSSRPRPRDRQQPAVPVPAGGIASQPQRLPDCSMYARPRQRVSRRIQ